jgi:hypothetical protein
MDKLDRLGWAAGISVSTFGVRIGVRVSAKHLLEPVPSHLPLGWKPEISNSVERLYSVVWGSTDSQSSVRRFSFLYGDVQQLVRTMRLEELYRALESDLDFYVAQTSRQRLFVHAGVVGWKGWAIVIPGRSQSGKTTLVKALLEAGASYYSDEYAVLDGRGRVYPFPRPLSIRRSANPMGTRLSAESLGFQTGAEPIQVGLVALTHYEAGAQWNPRTISPGKGTLRLVANTPAARKQPERAFATLGKAVCRIPILAGTRGEAAETAVSILHLMENSTSLLFATRRNRK